jgi:hypothetical protein
MATKPTRREFLRDATVARERPPSPVPFPPPRQGAQGAKAPEAKIGTHLIGKLEGPELVLDATKWPKKFAEAPMLAEMVKAGKLPPVEKRLPDEPMVVKPLQSVGGTVARGGEASPAPATARTATASSPPTRSSSGTTRAPRSCPAWPRNGSRATTERA